MSASINDSQVTPAPKRTITRRNYKGRIHPVSDVIFHFTLYTTHKRSTCKSLKCFYSSFDAHFLFAHYLFDFVSVPNKFVPLLFFFISTRRLQGADAIREGFYHWSLWCAQHHFANRKMWKNLEPDSQSGSRNRQRDHFFPKQIREAVQVISHSRR